MMKKNLVLKWD